eukprot:5950727-Prymnesium_polylepis.1
MGARRPSASPCASCPKPPCCFVLMFAIAYPATATFVQRNARRNECRVAYTHAWRQVGHAPANWAFNDPLALRCGYAPDQPPVYHLIGVSD